MSRISLDQINARLSAGNQPQRRSYEDNEELPAQDFSDRRAQYEIRDDSESSGVGFYASLVGTFLAVGLGSYVYFGGGLTLDNLFSWEGNDLHTDYISSVDANCKSGWQKGQHNIDQMHCYLTKDIARLCEPQEREHLAMMVERFWDDGAAYDSAETKAGFKMITKQSTGMQLGMEASKLSSGKLTKEQEQRSWERMAKLQEEFTGDLTKVQRSRKKNERSMQDVRSEFRKLVSRRYLARDDFGWYLPDWAKATFESVKLAGDACKTLGKS